MLSIKLRYKYWNLRRYNICLRLNIQAITPLKQKTLNVVTVEKI